MLIAVLVLIKPLKTYAYSCTYTYKTTKDLDL